MTTSVPALGLANCTMTPVGMEFPKKKLPFVEWNHIGIQLASMHNAAPWLIGDWYNYGDRTYGEMAASAEAIADAVSQSGQQLSPATVQEYSYIARSFEITNRFVNLRFKYHVIVRAETPAKQKKYLVVAVQEKMTTGQFKSYVDGENGIVKDEPTTRELSAATRATLDSVQALLEKALDETDLYDGDTTELVAYLQKAEAILNQVLSGWRERVTKA